MTRIPVPVNMFKSALGISEDIINVKYDSNKQVIWLDTPKNDTIDTPEDYVMSVTIRNEAS